MAVHLRTGDCENADIMLEKLARWKEKKAKKQQVSDTNTEISQATGRVKRLPLKETEQHNQNHLTQLVKKPNQKTNKSSNMSAACTKHGLQKSALPGPEMSMREKLKIWQAQRQKTEKKKTDSSSSVTVPLRTSRLCQHPSRTQARPNPGQFSRSTSKDFNVGNEIGIATSKHSFCKSSARVVKRAEGHAVDALCSASGDCLLHGMHVHVSGSQTSDREPPETEISDLANTDTGAHQADHLPVTLNNPTSMKQSKRKAVSFHGDKTPVRCSPRIKILKKAVSCEQKTEAATTTPKPLWHDKTLDMQQRLENWLASKGKTPSRSSQLLNFKKTPADAICRRAKMTPLVWQLDSEPSVSPVTSSSQDEEELIRALSSTMDECFQLQQSGCPAVQVSQWLDTLVDKVPAVQQYAKYWLCRISLAQDQDRDANEIINLYEDAVRQEAKPIQDVKDSVQQYATKLINSSEVSQGLAISSSADLQSGTPQVIGVPSPVDHLLQSSVLKYCLTESTPYFNRIRSAMRVGQQVSGTSPGLRLVTPVRRSTRLERRRSCLPSILQDHDVCLASLDELPTNGPQEFILRTNRALEDDFIAE